MQTDRSTQKGKSVTVKKKKQAASCRLVELLDALQGQINHFRRLIESIEGGRKSVSKRHMKKSIAGKRERFTKRVKKVMT